MPRVSRTLRLTFNGGELAPELWGRSDLDKYYTALETMENWIALVHGPAERRSGTHFVAEVKDSDREVRLRAFEFSSVQVYMLEFGHLYMRVYKDGGQVQSGGAPFELATPYEEDDLGGLQFAQDADTLYIAHPDFATRKVIRLADDDWEMQVVKFLPPPSDESSISPAETLTLAFVTGFDINVTSTGTPFLDSDVGRELTSADGGRAVIRTFTSSSDINIDIIDDFGGTTQDPGDWTLNQSPNTTLTPDIKGPRFSIVVLTLTAAGWRAGTDEGKIVKINKGIIKLTEITSTTVARGQVLLAMTTATAALGGEWTLNEEVWTAAKGYPRAITMHEGRMLLGGTYTFPDRFWGSATGIDTLEDFGEGADDGDAYSFALASSRVDAITWLKPAKRLFVGTVGSELVVNDGQNDPVAPTNVVIRPESGNGSPVHEPLHIDNALIHINRHQNKLFELGFNLDQDSFVATNLLLLAQHFAGICPGTIVDLSFTKEPQPIIWINRSDGQLLGLTYNPKERVIAGHRHIVGGAFDEGIAEVESHDAIPHWTDAYDTLWMVVKRTINGVTKRYIEYFDRDLNTDSALVGASEIPFTTVAGLDHLEGETVRVVEDHIVASNKVVVGGEITLDTEAFNAEVGLNYNSTLKTLPLQNPGVDTFTDLVKRISKPIARVQDIATITINGIKITKGTGQAIFSGEVPVEKLGYDRQGQVTIVIDDPYPARVIEIAAEVSIDEDRR